MNLSKSISILAVSLLLAPTILAATQDLSIADVLQGSNKIASSIAIKDLSDDYKPVHIAMSNASFYDMMSPTFLLGMGGQAQNPSSRLAGLCWTKGEIVRVQGTEFLVTYRLTDADLFSAINSATVKEQPMAYTATAPAGEAKLSDKELNETLSATLHSSPNQSNQPTTSLRLSLLKVSEIQKFEPDSSMSKDDLVRAFPTTNATGQIAQTDQNARFNAQQSNIKQIGLAAMLYASDYDDVYPYVQSTKAVEVVTRPYYKNSSLWQSLNPNGGRILFNMALAGVSASSIGQPAETVLLYESSAWSDGRRIVVFADGHSKGLDQREWERYQKSLLLKLKKVAKPFSLKYEKQLIQGN